jgi:hypothetical protein
MFPILASDASNMDADLLKNLVIIVSALANAGLGWAFLTGRNKPTTISQPLVTKEQDQLVTSEHHEKTVLELKAEDQRLHVRITDVERQIKAQNRDMEKMGRDILEEGKKREDRLADLIHKQSGIVGELRGAFGEVSDTVKETVKVAREAAVMAKTATALIYTKITSPPSLP